MLIDTIRNAEQTALSTIDNLRRDLVLRIAETRLDVGMSGLKKSIKVLSQQAVHFAEHKFSGSIREAWNDGIVRAEKELPKGQDGSLLLPKVQGNIETLSARFENLGSGIGTDISILVGKYGDGDKPISDLVQQVNTKFEEYRQRAAGIVNYELVEVERNAKAARISEAHSQMKQRIKNRNADPKTQKKVAGGKYPMSIKTWQHGDSMIPRAGHLALNGLSVPIDMTFKLRGKSATYRPQRPHDASLPAEENANCSCDDFSDVVFVTDTQEKAVRAEALRTGGIANIKAFVRGIK